MKPSRKGCEQPTTTAERAAQGSPAKVQVVEAHLLALAELANEEDAELLAREGVAINPFAAEALAGGRLVQLFEFKRLCREVGYRRGYSDAARDSAEVACAAMTLSCTAGLRVRAPRRRT